MLHPDYAFSESRLNCHDASQMKHQLDATLCRFYFCRVTLHVSGASAYRQEYLKLVRRPLVHVLSLQVSHHISLLWPEALIRRCDDLPVMIMLNIVHRMCLRSLLCSGTVQATDCYNLCYTVCDPNYTLTIQNLPCYIQTTLFQNPD